MSTKTFNPKDLDPSVLKAKANLEAIRIWDSSAGGRRTRSFQQLKCHCMLGASTEIHLQNNGYKDNPKKYMDLFDSEGVTVEVKTIDANYKSDNYIKVSVANTVKRCTEQKLNSIQSLNNGGSYDYGEKLMIWVLQNNMISFHSSYIWDQNMFIKDSLQINETMI